jgi:cytosine deaminase
LRFFEELRNVGCFVVVAPAIALNEATELTDRDGGDQVFANVHLPLEPSASFDIVVRGGRIERLERHSGEPQWVLFPPLADLHVHANRAFTAAPMSPSSLDHAIHLVEALFRDFGEADYCRQAKRLFAESLRWGTTRLRTHADINRLTGLKGIRGTLQAAEEYSESLDVEVVAFAGAQYDPIDADVQRGLREATALGVTLLGAVPAYYANPRASIDALLELAVELNVGVDVHLDEHLDAARSLSGYLAAAVRARGLDGRVSLSHGCALSVLESGERARVIDALARARITVISLPTTNLYLQDRQEGAPQRRGLAPLRELAHAGVPLRFASDNVRDVFFPYGSADLLDVAQLVGICGHIDDPSLLLQGICHGRDTIRAGDEASFLVVRGSSLMQVLSERPRERVRVSGNPEGAPIVP